MKPNKLLPLFMTQSFRSVAVTFLGFFSSVYIYQQTLARTGDPLLSLLTVAFFYGVLFIFKLIGLSLAENGAQKKGLKNQLMVGLWLTALAIAAFGISPLNPLFVWVAAATWGLAIGFFWFGRFGLLLKIGQRGRFGNTLGWAGILETALLMGVPFLGGLIISRFGYAVLFLIAFGFVALALVILRKVPSQATHQDAGLGEVLRLFFNHKRMLLTYFSCGARGTLYSTALMIYIFLVLQKELSFGIFFSLALLLVAMANLATGNWVDRRGKRQLVAYGAVISSLAWWGRFLSASVGMLFVLDVIDRISGGMLGIPLEVLSYEKALDGRSTGRALLFRETAVVTGEIAACLLLAMIIISGCSLKVAFLVAGVFNLLPLLSLKRLR